MKKNKISDDLLVKYLLNEATETERRTVSEWMSESVDNKNHFNDLKLIWSQSKNLNEHTTIDADEAWKKFGQRIERCLPHERKFVVNKPSYWLRIAATLLLLAGIGGGLFLVSRQNQRGMAENKSQPNEAPVKLPLETKPAKIATEDNANSVMKPDTGSAGSRKNTAELTHVVQHKEVGFSAKKKAYKNDNKERSENDKAKEFVCNSTPCPIEICIVQSVKCQNGKPAIISTCSTIAPDESGQLRYRAASKLDKNCKLTIQEITIKRISTGETIVLTANSKPATAQDVFNYITGQKTGDITAGIFHSDCANRDNEDGITLDNKFGDLRLQ